MKAMVLKEISPMDKKPLEMVDLLVPEPNSKEILVKILACGVCHTELDEIEGRLKSRLPIIPGHEIVGRVEELGSKVTKFKKGDRAGIGKALTPTVFSISREKWRSSKEWTTEESSPV